MAEIANENMQIFGRKIFFVCSTFTLNTNIILRLMEQEYEVYKIDEPRQLRNLLKNTPGSIVYINADSHHQPQVWYNIISSFENDPDYDSCDFGVFSAKLKGSVRIRFEQGLKLKAGFFSLDKNFGEIMNSVIEKLDSLKAKGLRKFVRLKCAGEKSAEAYFINGNMMYKMNFVDISSIGVGLVIPSKYSSFVRINSVIQGLTIVLGNKQLKVNAKFHTMKSIPNGILAALIFTPDTPGAFRNYVRTYICEELQKRLNNELIRIPLDTTDYTLETDFLKDIKDENAQSEEKPENSQAKAESKKENEAATKEESKDEVPQNAESEEKTENKDSATDEETKETGVETEEKPNADEDSSKTEKQN